MFVFRSLFSNALLKLSAGSSKFSTSEVPTVGFSDITTKSELILTLENFFMNWKCTDYTVLACLQELGRNLHENKLISQENLQLMQMWVSDLISIGYKNTPVIPNEILPHEPCIGEYILIFFFQKYIIFIIKNLDNEVARFSENLRIILSYPLADLFEYLFMFWLHRHLPAKQV